MINITYEQCYNEAKKYKTLKEFSDKKPHYCSFAYSKGWINSFIWLERIIKPKGYWNIYENCYEEAKKYLTRREFHEKNRRAYDKCKQNGWLDEFDWLPNLKADGAKVDSVYCYIFKETNSVYVGRTLMIRQDERHKRHLYDKTDTVRKYSAENSLEVPKMTILEENLTVKEGLAREDYWKNKYKADGYNIINVGKTGVDSGSVGALGNGKWDYDACYQAALQCKGKGEFEDKFYRAFFVSTKMGWINEYTWFIPYKEDCDYWTQDKCYEFAKTCKTRKQFALRAPGAYKVSCRNCWINKYTWFDTSKNPIKWTYESTIEEAKKYNSKIEFFKKNSRAYKAAQRNGWLKDYTWMVKPPVLKKWTYENCYKEAKKYKRVGDFAKNASGAYHASINNGWRDEYTWFKKINIKATDGEVKYGKK